MRSPAENRPRLAESRHAGKKSIPLSPRRRKLRWTIAILLAAAALGSLSIGWLSWRSRPKPYHPGEKLDDVTSSLARTLPANAPQPRFTDATHAAGLDGFRNFAGARTSQLPEDMGPGLAWGDFNNDGYDDLFLVSAGGPLNVPTNQLAPCALYENLGNGQFKKVTTFPDLRIHGMAAAWGDYDGDGYLDLIVTGYNALLLFHNDKGTGRFTRDERFPNPPGFWSGAAWGDYDNDRRLDLYICGYVQYASNDQERNRVSQQLGTFVPFTLNPSSYAPAKNLLFHNDGGGAFTEVAEKLGVTDPTGRSLGALWIDFDNDGRLDLYVANDISDNAFYHNNGHGGFTEIGAEALVADYRSGMGLAAGDFDHDGDEDLFITHWVGQENALYRNLWCDARAEPPPQPLRPAPSRRPASKLRFMDVADMCGLGQIAIPYVGWGTEFADFDNDGWLDLIVANGSTLEVEGPPPKKLAPQECFLFWSSRGEFFYNLAPLNSALSEKHVSRGLAISDYNNDGRLDVAIAHLGEGVQLLRNDMAAGHWIAFRLKSLNAQGRPLGFGDGARVIVRTGAVRQQRTVASASYLSQSARTAHFGLGEATRADEVEVHWLGGGTNAYDALAADRIWEITEGQAEAKPFQCRPPAGPSSSEASAFPKTEQAIPRADSPLESPSGWAEAASTARAHSARFWDEQRAAMAALKIQKNPAQAIPHFEAALRLNPQHEDSLYYLAECLADTGRTEEALDRLRALEQIDPQSHRAFQQWGRLRAMTARSAADLAAARQSLLRAVQINPEETGALRLLGEVSVLAGDWEAAGAELSEVCQSNPRSAPGFFLLGYLAWRQNHMEQARRLLAQARHALGPDWKPKGATAEGDVKQLSQKVTSPLAPFWEKWDGAEKPEESYRSLDGFLRTQGAHREH